MKAISSKGGFMGTSELKVFECGENCHIAARDIDEARQVYLEQYGGEQEDEISEVPLDATTSYVDGECGDEITFESITYKELIAYQASRGRKFPDAICFSGDYC
jgi:hypothetical protein